ncbi:hypothetical protein D3C71_1605300 [compost metagenome]
MINQHDFIKRGRRLLDEGFCSGCGHQSLRLDADTERHYSGYDDGDAGQYRHERSNPQVVGGFPCIVSNTAVGHNWLYASHVCINPAVRLVLRLYWST